MSLFRNLLLASTVLPLAACGADDVASPGDGAIVIPAPTPTPSPTPTPTPTPTPGGPAADCPAGTANVGTINNLRNCQISGVITGNRTIANLPGVIYSLSGRVQVGNDVGGDGNAPGGQQAVLTIEPGTVIFGSSGADFLLVNRGSQLFAEGTATKPIIFTSRQNIEGTATADSIGQWGGIVILGRAPVSNCIGTGVTGGAVDCQGAVEGTSNAFYGGASPNDNSGRIRYVQVRYPGFEVAPGNELNGITLAGVGAGTTIDHVQVHNSSDDGIEWFGGTVNQKYVVITGADDDSLDTDVGFKGFIQFALVMQRATGGDRVIEADSDGSEDATPRQNTRLANFTFVSKRSADPILLRGGTDFSLVNGVIVGTNTCIDIDGNATVQAADPTKDEVGPIRFESVVLACPTPFRDEANVPASVIDTIFGNGTNNQKSFTASLVNGFVNGANEAGVTAFKASTLGSFFVDTTYIGAVKDANDTWFAGWTCGLGLGTPTCEAIPQNTAS